MKTKKIRIAVNYSPWIDLKGKDYNKLKEMYKGFTHIEINEHMHNTVREFFKFGYSYKWLYGEATIFGYNDIIIYAIIQDFDCKEGVSIYHEIYFDYIKLGLTNKDDLALDYIFKKIN